MDHLRRLVVPTDDEISSLDRMVWHLVVMDVTGRAQAAVSGAELIALVAIATVDVGESLQKSKACSVLAAVEDSALGGAAAVE
jgi:hypothetical protein